MSSLKGVKAPELLTYIRNHWGIENRCHWVLDAIYRELWTADNFLEWLQPGVHADLIDGEKFRHSPVSLRHANLTNFVDHLLAAYIEKHRHRRL